MSPEDCRQTLGVSPDAGAEAIRQAYIDLARVWHPDRFESDARLRKIAEQRFQAISQAYTTLKTYRGGPSAAGAARPSARPSTAATEEAPPPPPPQPPPPRPAPQPAWRPPARPRPSSVFRMPHLDSLDHYAMIVCLVCAPFLAAYKFVPLLRTPVFDSEMVAAHGFRPRILEPMRGIDASADVRTVADNLTLWAHGDVVDLWKPVGSETAKAPAAAPIAAAPRVRAERKPAEAPAAPPPPANGTELLTTGREGAGEMMLANHSDLEAVVKLVNRNRAIVRAVYVAPKSSAIVHAIGVGVYNLDVDLGRDLDTAHLRFKSDRFTPAPVGPFQFAEITSETGVSGNRYDVVLNSR